MPHRDVALAKISAPQAGRIVPRARLFERLDEVRNQRLIWIAGPGGSGKTALASSYIAARNCRHLWYQLDTGETDVATFFHYLGLAAAQATRQSQKSLPALTPEYLPGLATFTRRFMEELAAWFGAPALIVLDNYEGVPPDAPLHGVLRDAANCLPQGFAFLVLSRAEPPPEFARLRLHADLAVLDGAELCLTLDEAHELASPSGLDASHVDQIHQRTRGWIAGFLLLLWDRHRTSPTNVRQADVSTTVLFDYFAQEVFEGFSRPVQTLLLRAALLTSMSAEEARQISGNPDAGRILDDLQRQNYFVARRAGTEPSYEFHPLFRGFLLKRAEDILGPDEWSRLQSHAALLLEQHHRYAAAVGLYRRVENWPRLMAVALREAPILIAAGRNQTLIQWLDDLPSASLNETPWLSFWRGVARAPFDPAGARLDYERAYSRFQEVDDPAGLYAAWAGVMETYFLDWGDFRPVDHWIREMEWLRARHPAFPSIDSELRTYTALAPVLFRNPEHPFYRDWIEQALAKLDFGQDDGLILFLGSFLVGALAIQGEYLRGRTLKEKLAPLALSTQLPPMFRIFWYVNSAIVHCRSGDIEKGLMFANEGLRLSAETGLNCWDFLLHIYVATCHLMSGRFHDATPEITAAEEAVKNVGWGGMAFIDYLKAADAYQRGQTLEAIAHLKSSRDVCYRAGTPFIHTLWAPFLAALLAETGSNLEAAEYLKQAQEIADGMGSRAVSSMCAFTAAKIAFDAGKVSTGCQHLAHALALGHPTGDTTWAIIGPKVMAKLYNEALKAEIEVEQVQGLIRRCHLRPPNPADAADLWPWPVKIQSLGEFQLLLDGKPPKEAARPQRKPLELLWFLIAQGPGSVPQESAMDALWPEAEGDGAYRSLITTLKRLRQFLDCSEAVTLHDGQLALDDRYLWVDAWAFEQLIKQSDDAFRGGRLTEAEKCCERALSLYQGDFLPHLACPNTLRRRDRLRAAFRDHLIKLAECMERAGNLHQAVDWYRRAIAMDDTAETFYLKLIEAHLTQGQAPEARDIFQRCVKIQTDVLKRGPSRELKALGEKLGV